MNKGLALGIALAGIGHANELASAQLPVIPDVIPVQAPTLNDTIARATLDSVPRLTGNESSETEIKLSNGLVVTKMMSPRDSERATRTRTDFIVLHTTEGRFRASIERLLDIGGVQYTIDTDGTTYLTLNEDKVGNHVGVHRWNGVSDLDERSIGIELVGCSRVRITPSQEKSLSLLLSYLIDKYSIPSDSIVTHSMVAVNKTGSPDKFVRGRKEDGIQFADPAFRARLGIGPGPSYDPDVRSGNVSLYSYLALLRDLFNLPGAKQIVTSETASSCPKHPYSTKEIIAANKSLKALLDLQDAVADVEGDFGKLSFLNTALVEKIERSRKRYGRATRHVASKGSKNVSLESSKSHSGSKRNSRR